MEETLRGELDLRLEEMPPVTLEIRSFEELARFLRVTEGFLGELIRKGRRPSKLVRVTLRVPQEAIANFLQEILTANPEAARTRLRPGDPAKHEDGCQEGKP